MDLSLGLMDVLTYVEGTSRSKCIEEGDNILKSRNLVTCGIKSYDERKGEISVLGLCLQSSAIHSFPHTVEGELRIVNNSLKIGNFKCSCKGGAAGVCKHCVAVLLYFNRNTVKDIEQFSVTDVKCLWAEKKQTTQNWYKTVPLQDFCCVTVPKNVETAQDSSKFREEILNIFPDCALAKHAKRKRLELPSRKVDNVKDIDCDGKSFVSNLLQKKLEFDLPVPELGLNLSDFYNRRILLSESQTRDLALCSQNSTEWEDARKLRITASRCYELYTYTKNKSPNWQRKISSFLNSSFSGNAATKYGIETEGRAVTILEGYWKKKIYRIGLLVNSSAPWLGCSPDGLIKTDGNEVEVVEIKCPVNGKKCPAVSLVATQPFLKVSAGTYELKKNHRYYGQIQLQLYLTGAETGKLVIFSSFDNSFVVMLVKKDVTFLKQLLSSLHVVYFSHMLPMILSSTNEV